MNSHSPDNLIEVHRFESAPDFVAVLSPSHSYWQSDPSLWMFRGHADDSWQLLAKAHRLAEHPYKPFGVRLELGSGQQEWAAFAAAEEALLRRFRRAIDSVGLPIPTRAPALGSYANYRISSADTHPDAVPLLALAQHFGLPTKLLDWSRHARIGAYFASAEAAETSRVDVNLAVWALRADFVASLDGRGVDDTKVSIQTAPATSNPNLHAQQGLFTRVEGENAHSVSLDRFVERVAVAAKTWEFRQWHDLEGRNPNKISRPLIRRLLLPQSEAPRLLRLLAYEGITGATMYPGYDGVVRALREEALWDRPRPLRAHRYSGV